jgi:hypothetical protein
MRVRKSLAAFLPVFGLLSVAHAEPPPKPGADSLQSADGCVVATAVPRYQGYGYTHTVELKNNCTRAVSCELWTDVDPTPHQTVQVQPGETGSVTTRKGSPAREFKAEKSCKY